MKHLDEIKALQRIANRLNSAKVERLRERYVRPAERDWMRDFKKRELEMALKALLKWLHGLN